MWILHSLLPKISRLRPLTNRILLLLYLQSLLRLRQLYSLDIILVVLTLSNSNERHFSMLISLLFKKVTTRSHALSFQVVYVVLDVMCLLFLSFSIRRMGDIRSRVFLSLKNKNQQRLSIVLSTLIPLRPTSILNL